MSDSNGRMTKHELDKLLQLVKAEAKALKTATAARAAQVLADFEQKISKRYCVNESPVWAKLFGQAQDIIRELNAQILTDLKSQDIAEEYAPQAGIHWLDRGENAISKRRAELRQVAKSRALEDQTKAQTRIDLWSVQEQKELLTQGLQSQEARNFLERRPSLERLMPALELADVEKELDKEQQAESDYNELPWRSRY